MIDPKKFEALRKEFLAAKAAADEAACAYKAASEANRCAQQRCYMAEQALGDYWYECAYGEKQPKMTGFATGANLIVSNGSFSDNGAGWTWTIGK